MPIGIVIPVDEIEPIFRTELAHFTDYQKVIGGYFQVIDLTNPEASLYVDEEGKLKHLQMNRRATMLMWIHNPAFMHRDIVTGPALIVGPPDKEGETQNVPQELDDLLFDTLSYKVEVQTIDNGEAWNSNQRRYSEWPEAYNAGLSLAERWMAVERVRIVPA